MTEFESERPMPAGPDAVFAVVSDLGRLTEWLPHPVAVRPAGGAGGNDPGAVQEVHAGVESWGVDTRGSARVRADQLRVEWGGESADYAGYLQVMGDDPDRSSVLVHLSFLGEQPGTGAADEVRAWLDDALDRLERLIGQAATTS